METISPYQRRPGDMYDGSATRLLKRKFFGWDPIRETGAMERPHSRQRRDGGRPGELNLYEPKLLESFDRRMRALTSSATPQPLSQYGYPSPASGTPHPQTYGGSSRYSSSPFSFSWPSPVASRSPYRGAFEGLDWSPSIGNGRRPNESSRFTYVEPSSEVPWHTTERSAGTPVSDTKTIPQEKAKRLAILGTTPESEKFDGGAVRSFERADAGRVLELYKKPANKQLNQVADDAPRIRENAKAPGDLGFRSNLFFNGTSNARSSTSNASLSKELGISSRGISRTLSKELSIAALDISGTSSTRVEENGYSLGPTAGGRGSGDDSFPGKAYWRKLLDRVRAPVKVDRITSLESEIEVCANQLQTLKLRRPATLKSGRESEIDETLVDAFTPLSDEAELAVQEALYGAKRNEVLAMHEKSNIDVTRIVIQCLGPGVWLNDEVINVYMELLKERELREPKRFLKCHFFNTFFYNKLYKDKQSYDYKAIRRWTAHKKLGYSLYECDKILVPIHQDIHWCLAVINIRDKKLQYLDSLKGADGAVLNVLSMYIADEVKDKDGQILDVSGWQHEFPQRIPEQLNGCDCGMFMVKYADFHSRGAPLSFTQDHMDYFRRRMIWEILQLKAG